MRRVLVLLVALPALAVAQGVHRAPPSWDGPRPAIDRGQWVRPVITVAGGTAHVHWRSGLIRPVLGGAWSQAGTVPQVAAAGRSPARAGPFTVANYYSTAAQSDGFDFAGDFSMCAVFIPTAVAANGIVVSARDAGTTQGWQTYVTATTGVMNFAVSGSAAIVTANGVVLNAVNVACVGRGTLTGYAKLNLGLLASAAVGAPAAATTTATRLGITVAGTAPLAGTLIEVWASSATPSDALFSAIMQSVKTRLGVSAW